ncbi:hypothetical protein [Natronorubrum halophilum]|uniref:hypothetical protein n=1 Tax=Natronorubrum halophilum TaxID=1702106 RepID=UPI0010C19C18|nr:hypothetical protein [Natronorubrum halophilum]
MVIPGYDPDDLDEALESRLSTDELEEYLTDSELERYRAGDENLVDLLDEDEIKRTLDRGTDSPDTSG